MLEKWSVEPRSSKFWPAARGYNEVEKQRAPGGAPPMIRISCDVHTHTLASRHAYSTIEENVRAAADQNFELLGSTCLLYTSRCV